MTSQPPHVDLALVHAKLEPLPAEERIAWGAEAFGDGLVLLASMQNTSLVLMHMFHRLGLRNEVLFIDTGYHFVETLQLRDEIMRRFGLNLVTLSIAILGPDPRTRGYAFSPLFDWTAESVEAYVRRHALPVHPLYARGYPSIGCAPCTTPVQPGEDPRAGRWRHLRQAEVSEEPKYCGVNFSDGGGI